MADYVEVLRPEDDDWSVFIPRDTPRTPPGVPIDDLSGSVCVRINRAWVPHLAGYLDGLTRADAWAGDFETVENARAQVVKLLGALWIGDDSCTGGGSVAYTIEIDGCNLLLKADGVTVNTVDLGNVSCLATNERLNYVYNIQQDNRVQQELINVSNYLEAYESGGVLAIDPDSTVFRRSNSTLDRYIHNVNLYATAIRWVLEYKRELMKDSLDDFLLALEGGAEWFINKISYPGVAGLVRNGYGLGKMIDTIQVLNTLNQGQYLIPNLNNAATYQSSKPETYTTWAGTAGYGTVPTEAQPLKDLLGAEFFGNEENFVAYMYGRSISERYVMRGDPLYSAKRFTEPLFIGHWRLVRGEDSAGAIPDTYWQGVEILIGSVDPINNAPSYTPVGDLAVMEIQLKFDRPVMINRANVILGWSGIPGNVSQVRASTALFNGANMEYYGEYTGLSSTATHQYVGAAYDGIYADRIVFYKQQSLSSVTDMWFKGLYIWGDDLPPANMFGEQFASGGYVAP